MTLAADTHSIAVGLPSSPGGGRVDVYRRSGADWSLAQSISAFGGLTNFGVFVSSRQSLLVISSASLSGRFDVYRLSPSGLFEEAGYTGTNALAPYHFGRTDGASVAVCATNCWTRRANAQGEWVTDATFGPGSQATSNGDQVLMRNSEGIGVYAAGSSQVLLQQLLDTADFAVRDGHLLARASSNSTIVRFFERDTAGVWNPVGEFPLPNIPAASLAVDGNRALVGIQSFSRSGSSWAPSRTVEAIVDPLSIGFGAAVSIAAGRAWVGSPEFNGDVKSGAAWSGLVSEATPTIPALRHLPAGPVMYVGFGQTIRGDGTKVAVASLPRSDVERRIRISVFDSATASLIGSDILTPEAPVRLWKTHVAVDGDIVAVARAFSTANPDILVYRNSGAGYVLAQTLTLPSSSGGNGHGRSVVVAGDWLQASRRSYHRGG